MNEDAENAETLALRVENLDTLIGSPGERGRIASFANKYDINPSLISQFLNGSRTIGEKAARKLERQIGLDKFALDNPGGVFAKSQEAKKLTPDQAELVERYDSLPPEAQKAFLVFLESLEAR